MKKQIIVLLAAAVAVCACKHEIPLSYSVENTAAEYEVPALPDFDGLESIATLPDPFTFLDGSKLTKFSQWEQRRAEIMAQFQYYETGEKFSTPKSCVTAQMHQDTIVVTVNVDDEILDIHCPVIYPEGNGPFPAIIGIGFSAGAGSLPAEIFTSRKIAMIGFPFTEVMAHQQRRGMEPINDLYPEHLEIGAYAAWPWGISRLIDGLEYLGKDSKIDLKHLAVSGCSFAGKMALFAGAFDERIALTIAQEPGGGGAAAWRVSEHLGEVETVGRTDYHWFLKSMKRFSGENVSKLPVDHHELCALVAPRALLVFGNPDYPWLADESGYVSCYAARKVWEKFGVQDRMGWSFQAGHQHCQLPEDQWPDLEAFVDRFLLGKEVDTDVRKAPMFIDVNPERWIEW